MIVSLLCEGEGVAASLEAGPPLAASQLLGAGRGSQGEGGRRKVGKLQIWAGASNCLRNHGPRTTSMLWFCLFLWGWGVGLYLPILGLGCRWFSSVFDCLRSCVLGTVINLVLRWENFPPGFVLGLNILLVHRGWRHLIIMMVMMIMLIMMI